MKPGQKLFLLPVIVFVLITLAVLMLSGWLNAKGVNTMVLYLSNVLLLILHLGILVFQYKALHNTNPNVFVRSVISGMMIKMLVIALAVIGYNVLSRSTFNKEAVFISLLLYLVYLSAEVYSISRLNREKSA